MAKLDEELAQELIQLARSYERESENQYRAVVRRVSQVRAMLKGEALPGDWWQESSWQWRHAEESFDYDKTSAPRYNYNIGYMPAWWEILQGAIQTVGIPGSTFRPQNSQQSEDREAAQAAKQIIDYQRTVSDFRDMVLNIYRLFASDGLVLAYTRHVPDAVKYGTTIVSTPIMAAQVVQQAGYQCFQCEQFTPTGETLRNDAGMIGCPGCQQPLHAENFMPKRTEQRQVGVKQNQIANGRELTKIFGALESFLPWWAPTLDDSQYCKISEELPKEEVIATFPGEEREITGQSADQGNLMVQARRIARLPMRGYLPYDDASITYSRWWFRPQCFYRIKDPDKRKVLLTTFPTGVFFQLAGNDSPVFLDAYEERMESKLTLMRPLKGDGMYTAALLQKGVPLQLAGNDAFNMALEGMLFAGFAQGLIDADVFSGQGISNSRVQPGTWKEIKLPGGKTLKESFAQMQSQDISQSVQAFLQLIEPLGEFLHGTPRVLQGGPTTNVRTSSGQSTLLSQALQRQAPAYGALKSGLASIQEKMVNEFLQNRTAETYYEVVTDSGDFERRKIQLNPNRGRVVAYPEASESIPQTWAQKVEAIRGLRQSQDIALQSMLNHPKNARLMFEAEGVPELTWPGKELAEKYERLIPILLKGQAKSQQIANTIDPTADPVAITVPSIAFDPVLDDPNIALMVIQEWAATPEGMQAAQSGSEGYQNLRAFAEQAWTARNMAMQATQPKPQKQTA